MVQIFGFRIRNLCLFNRRYAEDSLHPLQARAASEDQPADLRPNEIEVKSPKTRGRQLSIKDISSVTPEPKRGWDKSAATTKILFALNPSLW